MQNKNSDILSDEIIEILDEYFGDKCGNYGVFNMADTPYIMFSINFEAYKYFSVVLNYSRGALSCSISTGDLAIVLPNSQKWYDKADMKIFCKELQEQLELRIPDKFLEYHGWK